MGFLFTWHAFVVGIIVVVLVVVVVVVCPEYSKTNSMDLLQSPMNACDEKPPLKHRLTQTYTLTQMYASFGHG